MVCWRNVVGEIEVYKNDSDEMSMATPRLGNQGYVLRIWSSCANTTSDCGKRRQGNFRDSYPCFRRFTSSSRIYIAMNLRSKSMIEWIRLTLELDLISPQRSVNLDGWVS